MRDFGARRPLCVDARAVHACPLPARAERPGGIGEEECPPPACPVSGFSCASGAAHAPACALKQGGSLGRGCHSETILIRLQYLGPR